MTEFSERWLNRLAGAISGLNWLFLVLGSVASLLQYQSVALTAIALAGVYTVGFQLLPRAQLRRPIWREGTALVAAGLTAGAVSITGSFDSPFLLLAITPVLLAALVGGYRLGFATAGLSAGIVVAVDFTQRAVDYGGIARWAGLLMLVAGTFGLARRLLLEAMERVETLTLMSAATGARLEQLENANLLLTRLSELTESDDLSPTQIGDATLEGVRAAVPFTGAKIYMKSGPNSLLVAESGEAMGTETSIPIRTSAKTFGELHLYMDRSVTDRQRSVIDQLLTPTAVAFANVELVERIARTAIGDERVRIARELHDGIGPGLAALGLAIDLTAMDSRGAIEDQLRGLRSSVTDLVTDVRTAVTDLRSGTVPNLTQLISDTIDGTSKRVTMDLIEPLPIQGVRGENIAAVAIEAIRNALRHSEADNVTISGIVNGATGRVLIADDGKGFDPDAAYPGHFGLLGMRERSEKAGATLSVDSAPDRGTTVLIEWEPQ